MGGELRKIQDGGAGAALSPEGSQIAFLKKGEIWVMGANGEDPARLTAAVPGEDFSDLSWSPDGRWLTYQRTIRDAGSSVIEARMPGSPTATKIFESPQLQGFCWLYPGVLVLNLWDARGQPTSNLWDIHIDPEKMRLLDKPLRLTNWGGFAVRGMSASKDGRRLAVTKRLDQSDILVAEMPEDGKSLRHVRRFTSDERVDWPGGWSPDGRWLLFQSDRTGRMAIFRQRIDSNNAEALVADQGENRSPMFSPDGHWIVYLAWRGSAGQPKSGTLMRLPVGGGSPEPILETKGALTYITSGHVLVPTTVGHPAFRCPASAGAHCVLSEALGDDIVFNSFDVVPSASKTEIFRIPSNEPNGFFWDLSPDGSRVAYGERGLRSIRVREIRTGATRDIPLPDWPELYTIGWSNDGKSLFATDFAPTGSSLLSITLDGKTRVLYRAAKEVELPKASPDGHRLSFGEVVSISNVWLIEGIVR